MKVLVIGATGEVGSCVLDELLIHEKVEKVTALVRREIKSENPKLEYKVVDFDQLTELKFEGYDVAISALGTTMKNAGSKEAFVKVDYLYNIQFARLSQRSGVNSFHLVSAMGADTGSSIFYNKVKGDTERGIYELRFKNLHIYRPSLLDSERKERRIGERIGILVMRVLNPILIGPFKMYRSIKVSTVARGIVSRLANEGTEVILSDKI